MTNTNSPSSVLTPRVKKGKTVQLCAGKLSPVRNIIGGQHLPADHGLSDAELDSLVVGGYLEPFRATDNPVRTKPVRKGRKAKSPGKWNRDPRALEAYTLEGLNVMIVEIDEEAPLATTKEEAIALLSADYDPAVDAPRDRANNGGEAAGIPARSLVKEYEGSDRAGDGNFESGDELNSEPADEQAEQNEG